MAGEVSIQRDFGVAGGTGATVAAVAGEAVRLPEGFDLANATYARSGADLVLTGFGGERIVVRGYFDADEIGVLVADGYRIPGEVAARLAGTMARDFPPAGQPLLSEPIGAVDRVSGEATLVRPDGTRLAVTPGTAVGLGDVLVTGADGHVGVRLFDGTKFASGHGGLVAVLGREADAIFFWTPRGIFAWTGLGDSDTRVAAIRVETPVATFELRDGPAVLDFADGRNARVVAMEDVSGHVGVVEVENGGGTIVSTVAQRLLAVDSYHRPPAFADGLGEAEFASRFGGALDYLPGDSEAGISYAAEGVQADFETAAGAEEAGAGGPIRVVGGDYTRPFAEVGWEFRPEPVEAATSAVAVAAPRRDDELAEASVAPIRLLRVSDLSIDTGGEGGSQTLSGGSGADTLFGGGGADDLRGKGGNDVLYGDGTEAAGPTTVGLDIDVTIPDVADVRQVLVTVSGVPVGATLSAGTADGDIWTLSQADLEGLRLTLPEDFRDDFELRVTATIYTKEEAGWVYGASQSATSQATFEGGPGGADTLAGETGDDVLYGGTGDDTLDGGGGADTLRGGSGVDTLDGGGGADSLYGGSGDDLLKGLQQNDTLYGGAGQDSLEGGTGDDRLYGEAGDDVLLGEADNDLLYGGDGSDRLTGGAGTDTLWGGSGDDRFVFNSRDGTDSVQDAQPGDTLRFEGAAYTVPRLTIGENADGDAVIRFSGGGLDNTVTVEGVGQEQLSYTVQPSPNAIVFNVAPSGK